MTFDQGSLILVDYTAKIKDTDQIFETTIKADAEKHNVFEPDLTYTPKLISIGDLAYPVLKGFDEALAKTSVGDKLTVEVPPDKGFGERDTGKIRMIPIRKLGDDADKVSIGDTIDIDAKVGIVRYIGSGRVQVDFNHRHAGKTIIYDANVVKSLETDYDKIAAILTFHLSFEDSDMLDLKDNEANITIPERILGYDDTPFMKHLTQTNVFKFVPTLEKINFIDTYVNRQIKKEPTKTADPPQDPDAEKPQEKAESEAA